MNRTALDMLFVRLPLLICLLFSGLTRLYSQPFPEKKLPVYFYVGAMFPEIKTVATFDQIVPGVNTTLSLEDDLNFSSKTMFPFIRFIPGGRFQAAFSYMILHRKGEADLKQQFAFGDSVYSVGTNVKGYLDTDYYSLLLQYSIFNVAAFRAGVSLGARYMKIKAGFEAYSYGLSFKRDESYNIPVLLPGVHVSAYIFPNTLFRGSAEFLSVKINDTNGKIANAQISLEHYFLKFVGGGVGYSFNRIEATNIPENEAYLRDIEYQLKGFTFFAALRF